MKKTVEILVVVDMQKDFVDGALGTKEAVAILPAVVAKIQDYKARGSVILATQDTHADNYMDTAEGKNLPVVHCVKGSDGWALHPAVAAALPDGGTIEKIDPSDCVPELVEVLIVPEGEDAPKGFSGAVIPFSFCLDEGSMLYLEERIGKLRDERQQWPAAGTGSLTTADLGGVA